MRSINFAINNNLPRSVTGGSGGSGGSRGSRGRRHVKDCFSDTFLWKCHFVEGWKRK